MVQIKDEYKESVEKDEIIVKQKRRASFKRQFCMVRTFSTKFIMTFLLVNDLETLPFNKKIVWHYDFSINFVILNILIMLCSR